jgi:cytochrome d ubiquinol oxidase subunit I
MVALGALLSAAFIMAANSWMQHPVGYQLANGRAELTSFWAVLRNPVFLWAYTHVVLASLVAGATVMLAVSAWHLLRRSDAELFSRTAKLSLTVLIPGSRWPGPSSPTPRCWCWTSPPHISTVRPRRR